MFARAHTPGTGWTFQRIAQLLGELHKAGFSLPGTLRFDEQDGRLILRVADTGNARAAMEAAFAPWKVALEGVEDLTLQVVLPQLQHAGVRHLDPTRLKQALEEHAATAAATKPARKTDLACKEGVCEGDGVVFLYVPVGGRLDQVSTVCPCGQAPAAWRTAWPTTRGRLERWASRELQDHLALAEDSTNRMGLLRRQIDLARSMAVEVPSWASKAIGRNLTRPDATWEHPETDVEAPVAAK